MAAKGLGLLDDWAADVKESEQAQREYLASKPRSPMELFRGRWEHRFDGKWWRARVLEATYTCDFYGCCLRGRVNIEGSAHIAALVVHAVNLAGDNRRIAEVAGIIGTPAYDHGTHGIWTLTAEDVSGKWPGRPLGVQLCMDELRLRVVDWCRICDLSLSRWQNPPREKGLDKGGSSE